LYTSCGLFPDYALFLHPAESARPCETHTKAIERIYKASEVIGMGWLANLGVMYR